MRPYVLALGAQGKHSIRSRFETSGRLVEAQCKLWPTGNSSPTGESGRELREGRQIGLTALLATHCFESSNHVPDRGARPGSRLG